MHVIITSVKENCCKNKLKEVFENYITKIELLLRKESNTIITKDSTIFYLLAFYTQRIIFTLLLLS